MGIAALVEGTVEGDAQALGGLDSPAGLVGVDVAVGGEESYHHSVGSQLGGQLDVAQCHIHLLFGVAEIPSAWAYQHTGMQVQAVGTVFDGCRRWCGAAFAQGLAELYAVGASALGVAGRGDGVAADFYKGVSKGDVHFLVLYVVCLG